MVPIRQLKIAGDEARVYCERAMKYKLTEQVSCSLPFVLLFHFVFEA